MRPISVQIIRKYLTTISEMNKLRKIVTYAVRIFQFSYIENESDPDLECSCSTDAHKGNKF